MLNRVILFSNPPRRKIECRTDDQGTSKFTFEVDLPDVSGRFVPTLSGMPISKKNHLEFHQMT